MSMKTGPPQPDPECSAAWRRAGRADVVHLAHGDAGVFAVNQRPVAGKRGMRRVALRHGVSRLTSGMRHTVGLIFHDAA
jgi:hypothetical protein